MILKWEHFPVSIWFWYPGYQGWHRSQNLSIDSVMEAVRAFGGQCLIKQKNRDQRPLPISSKGAGSPSWLLLMKYGLQSLSPRRRCPGSLFTWTSGAWSSRRRNRRDRKLGTSRPSPASVSYWANTWLPDQTAGQYAGNYPSEKAGSVSECFTLLSSKKSVS